MQAAVTTILEAPPIFLAMSSQVSSFSRLAVRIFSVTSARFIVVSRCFDSRQCVCRSGTTSAGGLTAASPGFTSLGRRGS
jgi:hypothetical protein